MKKSTKLSFLAVILLMFTFTGVVGLIYWQFTKSGVNGKAEEVIFEVVPGSSLQIIAKGLQEKQLVKNAALLVLYAKTKNMASKLKRGEYLLNTSMTPDEVLAVITSGKSIARSLTLSEGLNVFDIATLLESAGYGSKDDFYRLIRDPNFVRTSLSLPANTKEKVDSLEGYLFPETYRVTKYETLKDIIQAMVRRFLTVYADIEPLQKQMGWTRHQVVTLASIIEKETGAAWERPLIASVFHNRMQKKMRLQTDPTVMYGVAMRQGFMPKNITRSDLTTPTIYNTYTIYGLPPGPISNPGREALLAVVRPDRSKYLYFVSQNNGTHTFSESYEAHNAAVKTYQLNAKAREGKSWRDLGTPKEPKTK